MSTTAAPVRPRRREVVPSSVLGMLIFVATEIMFFAGFISAFTISRAGAVPGTWSLPSGTLPAQSTALNTMALLASGVALAVANRQQRAGSDSARRTVLVALLLGSLFVVLQGREWLSLLAQGVTLTSSSLGAFFYVIVGAHALHAVGALIGVFLAWRRLGDGTLTPGFFLGVQTFWYFVVAVWPIIYGRVYF